ncbi:MAG: hypothetical protein HOQ34_18790, partial [Gemmatimonadaceae bacterium]|nr:hypothetical protein [Gemmatimonadaceae bacterium]
VGDAFSISVENAHTPGRAGGFTYTVALDCGDGAGYGAVGTERERSCPTSAEGTRTVKGKVLDQDGRFTEYTAVVRVVKRPQSITFTPPPPASATLGTSLTLAAAGGGSGNPVVFGTLTPSACSVSGSTVRLLAIGACTVSADQAGDATYLPAVQRTATIAVVWLFTGFLAPVDSAPALNRVNAGSAVPIKFGLGGDRGMSVLPGGSPASMPVSCATGAALGPATPTETPGKSGLTYDAASQTYAIVWRTDKGWAGSCRQLALTLADGSTHTARFEFR